MPSCKCHSVTHDCACVHAGWHYRAASAGGSQGTAAAVWQEASGGKCFANHHTIRRQSSCIWTVCTCSGSAVKTQQMQLAKRPARTWGLPMTAAAAGCALKPFSNMQPSGHFTCPAMHTDTTTIATSAHLMAADISMVLGSASARPSSLACISKGSMLHRHVQLSTVFSAKPGCSVLPPACPTRARLATWPRRIKCEHWQTMHSSTLTQLTSGRCHPAQPSYATCQTASYSLSYCKYRQSTVHLAEVPY